MLGCVQLLPCTPKMVTVASRIEKKRFFMRISVCIAVSVALGNSAAPGLGRELGRVELNAFISRSQEKGSGDAVAIKDLVDVGGMVTTAGGIILPNVPAEQDAPVVARIRQAGCVVAGKANLHEFAYGVTNINPHYGTALNPHDPGRVAGGSSGGSAVPVAAEMCDWAIGSHRGSS